jgi:hypothetical protein
VASTSGDKTDPDSRIQIHQARRSKNIFFSSGSGAFRRLSILEAYNFPLFYDFFYTFIIGGFTRQIPMVLSSTLLAGQQTTTTSGSAQGGSR